MYRFPTFINTKQMIKDFQTGTLAEKLDVPAFELSATEASVELPPNETG